MPATHLIVPIKSFHDAKQRLVTALSDEQRSDLMRRSAERVLAAGGHMAVHVITSDDEVRAWAQERGAAVVGDPGGGLSNAVRHAVSLVGSNGERVVVAHADLPLARSFKALLDFDGVSLVPDRHIDGTNVIALPARDEFPFAYGPGSFSRHLDAATSSGRRVQVLIDPGLAHDVDTAEDLQGI